MKYLFILFLLFSEVINAQSTTAIRPVSIDGYAHCKAFANKANTGLDASVQLQSCLNSLPPGAEIDFPPGVYNLSKAIVFNKSIHIGSRGVNKESRRCYSNDVKRCALFKFHFRPNNIQTSTSSYTINAHFVSFDHLIFSGDKFGPNRSVNCSTGSIYKRAGGSIRAYASHLTINGSVLKDQPCYTALEVIETANQFVFTNNLVANNGTHTTAGFWADGVTVHDNKDAVVTNNSFYNNTDVDLIFGGCQNCLVKGNVIRHSSSRAGSTFSALMIYAWERTSGNYLGSKFEYNVIDCGAAKSCGYGLYIGGAAWRPAKVYGAVVRYNTIKNAMVALAVDGVTGRTDIFANKFGNSGGVFHSRCIGTQYINPINIEPASERFINGNLFDLPGEMFSSDTYRVGCIYNHYNENPQLQNFEYLLTQFYYGFLNRDVESNNALNGWETRYNKYGFKALARAIANSQESLKTNSNNRKKIVASYRAILRRNPENERVIAHWNAYITKYGFNKMIDTLADSPESRRLNHSY